MVSGTTMALGAGVGRESIEFATRGLRVIGLDISRDALRLAALTARKTSTPVTFIQANFYDIPTLPARIDYIFLSGIMYSSIPGRQARQAWLRRLQTHLRSGGLAVLNYSISLDRARESPTNRPGDTFNSWLAGLPGANPAYQPGDLVSHDHFLHAFLSEEKLRSELTEAGATIVQLNWGKQFAVLTWPHEAVCDG
jgi:2-polyprenyl-3-methyl-5-hydroxy-6-metoxy-1,4-benzoquinol methylase